MRYFHHSDIIIFNEFAYTSSVAILTSQTGLQQIFLPLFWLFKGTGDLIYLPREVTDVMEGWFVLKVCFICLNLWWQECKAGFIAGHTVVVATWANPSGTVSEESTRLVMPWHKNAWMNWSEGVPVSSGMIINIIKSLLPDV